MQKLLCVHVACTLVTVCSICWALEHKIFLSIGVVLTLNSSNVFVLIANFSKYYQWNNCYWTLEQYWAKWLTLLWSLFLIKILASISTWIFHKSPLNVACFTFGKLKSKTLAPNKFKNKANDNLKLLANSCKGVLNKNLLLSIVVVF